jgi:hypothetical protein
MAALNLICASADARSKSAKHQFQKVNPCPSSGAHAGRCPGYVIDHMIPLCAGGADHHSNMQWQTVYEARLKDQEEARQCAALRRSRRHSQP